jgi:membrane protease YdiL (CAAX protease family)
MAKAIINLSLIIFYFLVSWFYPWGNIQVDSTISISYIWDFLFVIAAIFYTKNFPKIHFDKHIYIRLPIIALLATMSVYLIHNLEYPAPFRYIENIILQILILAPIVEELVFRQAIFGLLKDLNFDERIKIALGSFLFSLSHANALRFLPTEFHPFIYIQLVYTFILGWILIKARMRSQSIVEPMILHFIFNLIFYLSVQKSWI